MQPSQIEKSNPTKEKSGMEREKVVSKELGPGKTSRGNFCSAVQAVSQ
jgi:hypothetical protein